MCVKKDSFVSTEKRDRAGTLRKNENFSAQIKERSLSTCEGPAELTAKQLVKQLLRKARDDESAIYRVKLKEEEAM